MTAKIQSIYRYPVKGLTPEPLAAVTLAPGQTLPADRLYAIENGPSGFDPAAPQYFPKQRFLMLMRNERLAALDTHYDEASHTLTVRLNGAEAARGDLQTAEGRAAIEDFFARYSAGELRGPPKVLLGEGHSFSDVAAKVVSIINLASVAAVEGAVGRAGRPAALPWKFARRRLAGVAGIRPARADARGRRCTAESGEAHRALRRHQCGAAHRNPRSRNTEDPDAVLRTHGLRGLCGGHRRRDGRRRGLDPPGLNGVRDARGRSSRQLLYG